MTSFEKWSVFIGVCSALSTLLAVIVAIWGERIRQLWASPTLKLTLDEPAFTPNNLGQRGWYYILKVSNEHLSNPAINVRVNLTKVFKKAPDGTWIDQKVSGPTQVLWRWFNIMPLYITVGPDNHATFAGVLEGSDKIELKLIFYPNNLNPFVIKNDPTRFMFKAVSDNGESNELTVEVAWDGLWFEGRSEIKDHLIVKEVTT